MSFKYQNILNKSGIFLYLYKSVIFIIYLFCMCVFLTFIIILTICIIGFNFLF